MSGYIAPVSQRKHSLSGLLLAVPIAIAVLGVFAWVVVQIIAPPLLNVMRATQWVEVEAQVTGSRTTPVSPRSDYLKAEISYTYQWQGNTYTGDRYQFFDWKGKEIQRPQNIAALHPMGSQISVFVDPRWPAQSVIQRGLTMDARPSLFVLAILLLLTAAGMRELAHRTRADGKAGLCPASRQDDVLFGPHVDDAKHDPWAAPPRERQESRTSSALSILLATAFLLFWYGFCSSLIFTQWQERPHLLFLPLIPTLAPVCIFACVWYSRRQSMETRLILWAKFPDGLHFGRRNRVHYTVQARGMDIIKIAFSLEGHRWPANRENAIENLRRFFYRTQPFVIENPAYLRQGELWIELPADPHPVGIHAGNDIGWYLKALLYTDSRTRVIRMLELAAFPALRRDLAPWERQRAGRVVNE